VLYVGKFTLALKYQEKLLIILNFLALELDSSFKQQQRQWTESAVMVFIRLLLLIYMWFWN